MIISLRRIIIIIAMVITFVLFYTAPTSTRIQMAEEQGGGHGRLAPQCGDRALTFGNITGDRYFMFLKPRFGDGSIFGNMCFYLGLKYNRYFAMNTETPVHWYSLQGEPGAAVSQLQETKGHPTIMCSEQSFNPADWERVVGHFRGVERTVIGFVRDPQQVFLSCLLQKMRYRRKLDKNSVSIMLDENVNGYISEFEGNLKSGMTYMEPNNCHNHLSLNLGLTDDRYKELSQLPDEGVGTFVERVIETVTDFFVYEYLPESIYVFLREHCLTGGGGEEDGEGHDFDDYMFVNQVPERWTGLGIGEISPATAERLRDFLKYDYAVYDRVLDNLKTRVKEGGISLGLEIARYKRALEAFRTKCVEDRLSLDPEESRGRKYQLTLTGTENVHCRIIHASYSLLSNFVIQIQDANIIQTISEKLNNVNTRYTEILQIISDSLGETENESR